MAVLVQVHAHACLVHASTDLPSTLFVCHPLCVGIQRTTAALTENVCFCSRSVLLSDGGHVVGSYLLRQQTGDNEMGADRP